MAEKVLDKHKKAIKPGEKSQQKKIVRDQLGSHHFKGAKYLERGFVGRRQVLKTIYKTIAEKPGAVVLKGPGGIGKSTLATRVAANLGSKGFDFIVIRGKTSIEQILEAISQKVTHDAPVSEKEKLTWYLDHYLLRHKVVIIFDNFEENQDEKKGDFKDRQLKEFLWFFREALTHRETFLFFSTRYGLPGFGDPGLTIEIPEFSAGEFQEMLGKSKALRQLESKSARDLWQEIGGNPRALELLDQVAYSEFKNRDFSWVQLKELIPELKEWIIKKRSKEDDFTPLFLDRLLRYLTEPQRRLLDFFSIYRRPVPEAAAAVLKVKMVRRNFTKLAGLSLLECIDDEKTKLYYVQRLTAQYVLSLMEAGVKESYHCQAARYYEGIRDEERNISLEDGIEARWHFLQAGEWNRAAEITFDLESFLTLHGYPQWSMELLQELYPERLDETNRLVAYGRIGTLYQHFGEYDKSIDFHRKAYEIAKKNNDLKNTAAALHLIGNIYYFKGNYESALKQYEKAKETFEKIGDIKGLSESLHQIGRIYQDKGDYKTALIQYQKALKISEEIGDIKGVSDRLLQIGIIYQDKGEFKTALEKYEKAKETFEKIGDIRGLSLSLNQIGIIYQEKGEIEAALKQYEKAKEIFEKIRDIKSVSASLHNIGMIYQDKGDYDAALTQYRQAMEIEEKLGDIAGTAISMGQMGALYFEQDQFEAALKYFIQAYLLFSKLGSPNAKKVKDEIARCREKLPEAQFKSILKEFNLETMEYLEHPGAGK